MLNHHSRDERESAPKAFLKLVTRGVIAPELNPEVITASVTAVIIPTAFALPFMAVTGHNAWL